jgi:hypothetical protein
MADHSPQLAAELVSRCFHARTIAHILHLRTNSFALHMALRGFYKDIVPLADTFAEAYQGRYGLLTDYPDELHGAETPMSLLKELDGWIGKNRAAICADSHLQNIIDEIVALIDQTTYKVRFLK